jgi:hypothetical protein
VSVASLDVVRTGLIPPHAHSHTHLHMLAYAHGDCRYLRKANCLLVMQRETQAEEAYRLALTKDPNNQEAKEGLAKARGQRYGSQEGMSREERANKAMQDPEIQAILSDPGTHTYLLTPTHTHTRPHTHSHTTHTHTHTHTHTLTHTHTHTHSQHTHTHTHTPHHTNTTQL